MAAVNLIGSYNYALVALSVLIAMFASYAALDLASRVTAAGGWTRAVWLLGGAGAMGTGIWSMHYIGMLAFILPIPVAYHWPTVLLSLFAAILASVIALYVVSRQKMGASRAVAGSVLMGAGIASMHYIGMAAMRLPAICQFNSFLVVLSVVFAILISLAALWISFHFRDEKNGIGREKLAGAVVMGAAIPVMHYTGEIIWSEETFRIFQYDRTTKPTVELLLQRVHPEDAALVKQTIERASQDGKNFEHEYRLLMPDGSVKYVHVVAHALSDELGGIEFVGAVMDVTVAKRAEEALRQAQADLAHGNRVTTMGEVTASLAHEVNQPIAAAVTDANTCLRWLTRDHPDVEEARHAASRIVKDATRAGEIISRTRLLFKKGTPQWELVDVNEVIREMIVLLRSEATRYSISVRTELADLPQVMGDRVQLQQVLMNLMTNGIDAMKDVDGTRELAIKSQRAEDRQLLISVSDTGVGLPRQQADQIFNAFFTTKLQGTGMGLRISRSIVESHGGRLWAADNSQRGASFYIALPTQSRGA